MAFQPLPFAKRQKISSDAPNLNPDPPRQSHFHGGAIASTSSSKSSRTNGARSSRYEHAHGGYSSYYKKRRNDDLPGGRDPRLALIPPEWWTDAKVLDVGCNDGTVTVEVAQRLGAARVTGIDVDERLINSCQQTLRLVWSRQAPLSYILNETGGSKDVPPHLATELAKPSSPPDPSYFPLALPRMFGYLPLPPRHAVTTYVPVPETHASGTIRSGRRKVMPKEVVSFPANVQFEVGDWVFDDIKSDKRGYDIILALSVTKWIHLNGLNAGLLHFFTKCFSCLLPGGKLILEPQPFSTYAQAARKGGSAEDVERLKANRERLKNGEEHEKAWKHEDGDFEKVLLETVGFERVEKLGETGKQGFRRPVEVYHKKAGGSWT